MWLGIHHPSRVRTLVIANTAACASMLAHVQNGAARAAAFAELALAIYERLAVGVT